VACVSDEPTPPLTYPDRDGSAQTLLRAAAKTLGVTIEFVAEPRRRCMSNVSKGHYPILTVIGDAPSNRESFAFPLRDGVADVRRSIAVMHGVWVTRKDSDVAWDGKQLSGVLRPVLARGGTPVAENWLKDHQISMDNSIATNEQIVRMLAADRADVGLMHDGAARALLQQPPFSEQLRVLPTPAFATTVYLAFNKEFAVAHPALVESLWNEIARLRAASDDKSRRASP
jgi:polar amino acid transport system substrate-binding protein